MRSFLSVMKETSCIFRQCGYESDNHGSTTGRLWDFFMHKPDVRPISLYAAVQWVIRKVKLSRYSHSGDKGDRKYSSYSLMTSTLDRGKW
jgi:hypothetical protein